MLVSVLQHEEKTPDRWQEWQADASQIATVHKACGLEESAHSVLAARKDAVLLSLTQLMVLCRRGGTPGRGCAQGRRAGGLCSERGGRHQRCRAAALGSRDICVCCLHRLDPLGGRARQDACASAG